MTKIEVDFNTVSMYDGDCEIRFDYYPEDGRVLVTGMTWGVSVDMSSLIAALKGVQVVQDNILIREKVSNYHVR